MALSATGGGGERLIWYGDDVNDPDAPLDARYGGVDAAVLRESMESEGAVIMGRTTFDVSIEAWGEEPPIHKPCFVLTTRAAPPMRCPGGTTFTFVTEGPERALHLARAAAGGRDVGVMGGARTVRTYLALGLLDELRIHLVPTLMGRGLRLFGEEEDAVGGIGLQRLQVRDGERATHMVFRPVLP